MLLWKASDWNVVKSSGVWKNSKIMSASLIAEFPGLSFCASLQSPPEESGDNLRRLFGHRKFLCEVCSLALGPCPGIMVLIRSNNIVPWQFPIRIGTILGDTDQYFILSYSKLDKWIIWIFMARDSFADWQLSSESEFQSFLLVLWQGWGLQHSKMTH